MSGGSGNWLWASETVSLRWWRRRRRRSVVPGLFILASGVCWWGWISQRLAQSFLAETVEVGKLRNSWTGFLLLWLLLLSLPFCWDGSSSLHVGGGVQGPPLFPTKTPSFHFSTISPLLLSPLTSLSLSYNLKCSNFKIHFLSFLLHVPFNNLIEGATLIELLHFFLFFNISDLTMFLCLPSLFRSCRFQEQVTSS